MKFLMTYQGATTAPPSPETLAALGKYTQEMLAKGVVLMTGGLVRPDHGTKLKQVGGDFSVTDGPFPETKELIDGFALVRCDSREAAIAIAKEFMSVAGDGEGEILQVFDAADLPPRG
ncbi:MAG: hypothetical protein EOO73_20660 [Myxococcales bacterium]|nr:MAG: hypothetical protein EOO73_20660 [Myxococcales bacterium]